MTADRLQEVALRLANAVPTRYWLHWNHPCRSPWVMAVRVVPTEAVSAALKGQMAAVGFGWDEDDRMFYADRTNPDGSPFTGDGG